MKTAITLPRFLLALATLVLTGTLTAATNPVSGVSLTTALRDAHALAANRTNLCVVRVEGNSMLPFFGPGAVLVVKHLPAEKLRAGMVVVYTNRFNETVAHGLIEANASGWTAGGYSNADADSTPVTAENLMGVVYATFHSDATLSDMPDLAALRDATPVALAAPAR
jgi:signal peptidase I